MAKISFGDSRQVKNFDCTSPTKIAEDNGVVTGSPTYSRRGINLDGTNDYVTFAIPNTLLSHSKISIVVEFTPDIAVDADANYYLCDATINNRYYIFKGNNSASNVLNITLGNTLIAQIPSATYSGSWKQNERNVIVVSGTSGATNVWLNGTQILTNDASAWDVGHPTEFYAGVAYTTAGKFDGEIKSVSIYNDLLTADDAQNLYDNSLLNFKNKADVWLDMKSQVGKRSGTELIVGGMTYTNWTAGNDAVLTNPTSDVLRITYAGTNFPTAFQTIMTIGKRYRVTGEARGDGSLLPRVLDNVQQWIGTTSTNWQSFDIIFTAGSTGITLKVGNAGAGEIDFRNVSVQEVLQYSEDVSGKGNDFKLGDGSTTTKFPAFSNPGFDFDGGTDYMSNDLISDILNSASQTFVVCFKPDFAPSDDTSNFIYSTTDDDYRIEKRNDAGSNILVLYMGGIFIGSLALVDYEKYWNTHGLNVIVVAGTTGNTDIWLNAFKLMDSDNTAWSSTNPTSIILGARAAISTFFDGEIFHWSCYPIKFTTIQAQTLSNDLLRRYS